MSMARARLPQVLITREPKLLDYQHAVAHLRYELKAAEADGLSIRVIWLKAQIASYLSTIRRIRWRIETTGR